ncbi:MAG: tandem-95 repeat protein, partial [Aestuariibacter sp.]|nr:tandem-95 repeat protein [Aestuariibacter sp.]
MTTTQTIAPALLFTDVITGLADNGGNTISYALLSGSPALDVVPRNANDCGVAIVTDQRGIGRPQNALCDIGAYEVINNILPVAVDDTAVTDEEIVVTIDVLANDSDADFDALTVTDVFTPTNGTAVIVNNGTDTQFIEYTPSDTFEGGIDSFTYSISDGAGGLATATVVVTVNTVNDIPNAVDDNSNTVENTPVVIDVLANDVDENTLSLVEVSQPISGTAVINGSQILYTPPAGFIGTEIFGYVATDGAALSNFALVEVTVNTLGTNSPPTVSAGDDVVISILVDADLNGVANDDGLPVTPGTLTILWTQISGPGTATFADDSAATTTASFSADGVYILELSADDGEFSVSDQVMVTVETNAVPVAVDDTASTNENTGIIIDVLANDTDGDGDSLVVDSVTQGSNGTVVNNGTNVTYTPDANFNGADSFDYT